MRRFLYNLVSLLSLCSLTIGRMTAQVDPNDPGVFYIMQKPSGMTSFHEGEEWTITFGTTDTLDHRYNHPVSMNVFGGELFDSQTIAIDEIDSLIMYQPKSVFQEGVFVIDETNVGDVISVDSTMTTICFRNNALAYPQLGQHVVSDLTEQPLPDGFLGVVSEIRIQDDYIECVCNGQWKDLTEFYVRCIQSTTSSNGNNENRARYRNQQAARRIKIPGIKETIKFDDSWTQFLKISSTNGNVFDGTEFKDYANLSFTGSVYSYYKKSNDSYVIDGESSTHMTFHIGTEIRGGDFEASIGIEKDLPWGPLGKTKEEQSKAWSGEFSIGLFVHVTGKNQVSMTLPYYQTVFHICPGLLLSNPLSRSYSDDNFKFDGATFTGDGEFSPLRLQVKGTVKYKGLVEEKNTSENAKPKAGNDGGGKEDDNKEENLLEVSGSASVIADLHFFKRSCSFNVNWVDEVTDPNSLLAYYEDISNALVMSHDIMKVHAEVGGNFSIGKDKIKYEPNIPTVEYDEQLYHYDLLRNLPIVEINRNKLQDHGEEIEYEIEYLASEYSIASRKCELWIFNHQSKVWENKLDVGWSPGSWNLDAFVNNAFVRMPSQDLKLRKGKIYSICPAIRYPFFPSWNSDGFHTYTSPKEDKFIVPYNITTEDAKINFSTAQGKMTIDPVAVKDWQNGLHTFEVGFQCAREKENLPYAEKKEIEFTKLEEQMYATVLHEANAERWYRAYMIVDGLTDFAIYGEPKKFRTRNDECPSTQPATEITYTSAKLHALVNDQILSLFQAPGGQTQMGFVYSDATSFGASQYRIAVGKNGAVPFESQYMYYHIYQDLYPDCDYSFAACIIRPPADWSSPDNPDEEIDVPLTFHTKNPFTPITGEDITNYFKTMITGEIEQWVVDHFNDEQYKGIEVYFKFGKASSSMERIELDTPINGSGCIVSATIDDLENDQDYHYQLCIDTHYLGRKREYRGEIKKLHTPDAYKMNTLPPNPIGASTATFHANMNDYIAERLSTMKEIKYYFVYSTDKNAVEQLNNPHKVSATRSGKDFSANTTGLHYHATHYCRIIAEGYDKDDLLSVNLIRFKGDVVEFETPDLFKPQTLTAYPTAKGLAFKVTMLPEAEEIINLGVEVIQMTIRYASDKNQLVKDDYTHDVVMTWRTDKSDPTGIKYYYCDTVPVLDVNRSYYYRAVSLYNGHESKLDSYDPVMASVPSVKVYTDDATFDFTDAKVDMSGHIDTSLPEHLTRYKENFVCSFEFSTVLPDEYDLSIDAHDVKAQYSTENHTFVAENVYMPSGEDEAIDYYYRGVFTQDTYPDSPKVYGEFKSCTVYFYDPGVMAYVAPRYLDANGQWQRTELPAEIKMKLERRRAERAAAGRRFNE